MQKKNFNVISLDKSFYMKPDEYLNGWAKHCGWKATLVYDSLWRHSDRQKESFPSIELIAEEHGVSRDTVMRGIKQLEDFHIIQIEKKRNSEGKFLHNTYYLLAKSEWDFPKGYNPSRSQQLGSSKSLTAVSQVAHSDYKGTHNKETILSKDNIVTASQKKIHEILQQSTKVLRGPTKENQTITFLVGYFKERLEMKTLDGSDAKNRQYCHTLLKNFTPDQIKKMIDYAAESEFWSAATTSFMVLHKHGNKILKSAGKDKEYTAAEASKKFMKKHGF